MGTFEVVRAAACPVSRMSGNQKILVLSIRRVVEPDDRLGSLSYTGAFRNRHWWFQPWDLYSLGLGFVNRLDLLNRSLNLDQSFGQRWTQAD
jgi:hypothetical protein